jgi:DNA polymerase-1
MVNNLAEVFRGMEFSSDENLTFNSRVLFIDAMNLFIRNYAAVPSMDDNGNHIGGMAGFMKSLGLAIRTFRPTRCVIVFDGKGGSQRRRKVFSEYKQNRKPPVRLNRSYDLTTDEQERENLKWQLVSLVEMLECLPVTILALDNVEADDIIAYLTQLVTDVNGESIVYSTDKDFYQLASHNIKIYNPVRKKLFTQEVILEEFGIHPVHFHFFRALDGDKSDNIDGVKGVGQTSLKKYLPELADPSADISLDFIKNKFAHIKKVPKIIQNILSSESLVNRNLYLMNLHEGVISSDARLKAANIFHNDTIDFKKHDLTKLIVKNKLMLSFPNYDSWLGQVFNPVWKFSTKK